MADTITRAYRSERIEFYRREEKVRDAAARFREFRIALLDIRKRHREKRGHRTRIFAYEHRSVTRWPMERGAWPAGLNRVLEGLRSRARRGESVTHEGGTKEPGVPTKALAGCPGFRQTTSSPLCGRPSLRFTPSPPAPPLGTVSQRDYAWPRSSPSIRFRSAFLAKQRLASTR